MIDKVLPNLFPCFHFEVEVGQKEVNPGLKRIVNSSDAVRCQEQDALIIFELR